MNFNLIFDDGVSERTCLFTHDAYHQERSFPPVNYGSMLTLCLCTSYTAESFSLHIMVRYQQGGLLKQVVEVGDDASALAVVVIVAVDDDECDVAVAVKIVVVICDFFPGVGRLLVIHRFFLLLP